MKYWCNIFPFFCRGLPLRFDIATFDIIKNLRLVINVCISVPKQQVWILKHWLFIMCGVCWLFFFFLSFFAKQYNKCASLRFLLAVWNCFICIPCISSPSKKAERASRMSEASKQLQAYMTTPLVDPPVHPSLFTVAFSFPSTQLYCEFLVVYLLSQMQGMKFDLNSHFQLDKL